MEKKLLVKKSNLLVMSDYNISLIEHRFLNMCLGRIYKEERITPETKCKVHLKRYAEEYKVKEKEALSQFKKIKNSLITRKIKNLEGSESTICIINKIDFVTNEEIHVQFDKDFIKHIALLKSNFTMYDLVEVVGFKSEHSFRIYEMCKSVNHLKARWEFTVEVEKLKSMLNLEGKYAQYGSFKRMIEKCIKEINSQTSITVSLEESLLFKKVAKLIFKVQTPTSQDIAA